MEEKFSLCPAIEQRLTKLKTGKNIPVKAPKVSVIIPAYNIAQFIAETIDSVFAQTFKDFEVVLVNDGSSDSDELEKNLAPYFDNLIYSRQENLGVSEARNSAICLSRGELLAFLDGDDVWKPEFLESQINFLEKNELDMVYCDAELFGEKLFAGQTFMQGAPSNGEVTPSSLITANCNVITSGTILKRDLLVKHGMFDKNLPRIEDFDLWFRLAKKGAKIGYQKRVLLKYRVRLNSLSGTNVSRSERSILSLASLAEKYDLSAAEKQLWERQIALYKAEFELEKGKSSLVKGEFEKAQTHFTEANKFYRKPKLTLLSWLIRLAPKLTLQVFKKLRPAEFSFIAPEGKS